MPAMRGWLESVRSIARWAQQKPAIAAALFSGSLLVAFIAAVGFTRDSEFQCAIRAKQFGKVPDGIEKYILVGYGDKPACPLPNEATAVQVRLGDPTSIWVRAVYYDQLNKPAADTEVVLDAVTATGQSVPIIAPTFMLNPVKVQTDAKTFRGFYGGAIIFVAGKQDVYRIRATYLDKGLARASLGPLIIVH
jgi:hypothetical protein